MWFDDNIRSSGLGLALEQCHTVPCNSRRTLMSSKSKARCGQDSTQTGFIPLRRAHSSRRIYSLVSSSHQIVGAIRAAQHNNGNQHK